MNDTSKKVGVIKIMESENTVFGKESFTINLNSCTNDKWHQVYKNHFFTKNFNRMVFSVLHDFVF